MAKRNTLNKRYNESDWSYNDRIRAYKVLYKIESLLKCNIHNDNKLYSRVYNGDIDAYRELFEQEDIEYIEGKIEKKDGNVVHWIMPQSHFKILTVKDIDKLFKGIK